MTKKQQVTRDCHWVAQGYLKRWAFDPDRTKIWRTNTKTGAIEPKPIKKVSVRNHLYAPIGADGCRSDPLERKLSEIENWFGQPIWDHVCNGNPDLTDKHMRMMLSLLTATSFLRTPKQLEQWKAIHDNLAMFIDSERKANGLPDFLIINGEKIRLDPSGWGSFIGVTEEELKKDWNEWVGDAASVARKLMKLRWSMLVSEHPAFITSDHPVVITDAEGFFRGIENTETRVIFPLCPTRILMMDHRRDEPEGAFYGLEDGGAAVNAHIRRNAIRDIFTHRNPNDAP